MRITCVISLLVLGTASHVHSAGKTKPEVDLSAVLRQFTNSAGINLDAERDVVAALRLRYAKDVKKLGDAHVCRLVVASVLEGTIHCESGQATAKKMTDQEVARMLMLVRGRGIVKHLQPKAKELIASATPEKTKEKRRKKKKSK